MMSSQISEMLDLYNRSFPNLQTDEETFSKRLMLKKGSLVFEHRENDNLAGFSVVNADGILLLCVDAKYRRCGIGTELLTISEKHISKSFSEICLGTSRNTYLLCGVPIDDGCDFHSFFLRYGYSEEWRSCDMIIDLNKYTRIVELDNNDDDIIIRRRRDDKDDFEKAVRCGEMISGWGEIYGSASDLIVADKGGDIIGGVIVDPATCLFTKSLLNTGSFGGLGVIEKYRNRGIGMKLCQEALGSLKADGLSKCYIGYTYLDWWYSKLGAIKYVNYWIGKKTI